MRYLTLLLFLTIITSCMTTQTDDGSGAGVATAPSGLEGPAYDPSAGPVPMTASTPMPVPASSRPQPAAQQPAAYGQSTPMADRQPAPAAHGSVPMNPTQAAKGGVATNAPAPSTAPATAPYPVNGQVVTPSNGQAAPQAYGSVAAPPTYATPLPNTPEAILANQLTGMWVNGTDEREMVEFTSDHYTTYYNGEMLFQEPMTYHAACPGDCNGGAPMEIACFTISGPAGTDCYGIVRMTSTALELSLLGVSTETVTYYKQ